jgi:hypothetical protein
MICPHKSSSFEVRVFRGFLLAGQRTGDDEGI